MKYIFGYFVLLERAKFLLQAFLIFFRVLSEPRSMRIFAAACNKADHSNIVYVNGDDLNGKNNVFNMFRLILNSHKLIGKYLVSPDFKWKSQKTEEVASMLGCNVYKTASQFRSIDILNISDYVRSLHLSKLKLETNKRKIVILPVSKPESVLRWNAFLDDNGITSVFYNLDFIAQKAEISKSCFIYLSGHRVEAIETCFPRGTVGMKRAGLLFRQQLKDEKKASFTSKNLEFLLICKQRRQSQGIFLNTDIYSERRFPRVLPQFKNLTKVYANHFLKVPATGELLAGFQTRHRTEVKNAQKAGYTVYFKTVELINRLPNLLSSVEDPILVNRTTKIETIVKDKDGNIIGGIEVYFCDGNYRTHYYTSSLAYTVSNRLPGVQTFAIFEYMKNFCSEDDIFDFLGSRDKAISMFFRGFGSDVESVYEVSW